jgi:cysteinyl-tRNA synthetase, unknown class
MIERLERRSLRAAQPAWGEVNDFAYQLQNVDLAQLGQSAYDAVVIDYSADGDDATAFSRGQIDQLQDSPGGPKRVLSYLSVGEAEDYRWYWKDKFATSPPRWLGPENPEWEGNYKVKYWQGAWQNVVYNYLDRVTKAGFDGVYLDLIDAYEYWGPAGRNVNPNAERDMVSFVQNIAHYARVTRHREDFAIFAQNGEHLGVYDEFVEAVTGIGREDVWYDDDAKVGKDVWATTVRDLKRFQSAGRAVWVIDYPTSPSRIDDLYFRAEARGFVAYAATRELDELLTHDGHEPD